MFDGTFLDYPDVLHVSYLKSSTGRCAEPTMSALIFPGVICSKKTTHPPVLMDISNIGFVGGL